MVGPRFRCKRLHGSKRPVETEDPGLAGSFCSTVHRERPSIRKLDFTCQEGERDGGASWKVNPEGSTSLPETSQSVMLVGGYGYLHTYADDLPQRSQDGTNVSPSRGD